MSANPLHIFNQERLERERLEKLSKSYQSMFAQYPDVIEDILRDLGFDQDIDPRDIPANTLRNYGYILIGKAGMKTALQTKEEE